MLKKHHVMFLAPIFFRWTETKWIVDLANGQTGKPATRKAANNYHSRSIQIDIDIYTYTYKDRYVDVYMSARAAGWFERALARRASRTAAVWRPALFLWRNGMLIHSQTRPLHANEGNQTPRKGTCWLVRTRSSTFARRELAWCGERHCLGGWGVIVVHLGPSTCHATSGRGD